MPAKTRSKAVVNYNYNGFDIEFEDRPEGVYANATAMCQANGKLVADWLRLNETNDYASAIAKRLTMGFPIIKNSGRYGGTWIHEKLVLDLARWISLDFRLWCDEKIAELIKIGGATPDSATPDRDDAWRTGFADPLRTTLAPHTRREVQVRNSKQVNRYCFDKWNREVLIEYNRRNCLNVTGMRPKYWVEVAKNAGLKSTDRTSAKQVLRKLRPAWAAQMSMNDSLVLQGVKLGQANRLTAPCLPFLEKMIELAIAGSETTGTIQIRHDHQPLTSL